MGPGFVVVVVGTPDAAALGLPERTNPFSPPRTPTAMTTPMASVLPLPPLASSPSPFFLAMSFPFRGSGVDLADRRVVPGGDVVEGGGDVGQHDELHPAVGRPALGRSSPG